MSIEKIRERNHKLIKDMQGIIQEALKELDATIVLGGLLACQPGLQRTILNDARYKGPQKGESL